MGMFGKKGNGGVADVIRCDEQEYIVWKWRPNGAANSTYKENAIRWGSSLRVKDGEVAVFVYKQTDGTNQDFLVGPYDDIIKTANFPVISNIIGSLYDGKSPFQAEIYFINLAENMQIEFGISFFDVFDPRFLDFSVPVAAGGTITFNITDYKGFIKLQRLINFEMDDFELQIKNMLAKNIKSIVTNIPQENNIPVLQLERKLNDINDLIEPKLREALKNDFGVNLKRLDLDSIRFDKFSKEYEKLIKVTREQQEKTTGAQTDVNIKNLQDTQAINAENMKESLNIQREEMQRAQKLQTESNNMTAHQLDQQTLVAKTAAESMGKMGSGGDGGSGGGSMDPGSMMASMAMGGAVGSGMAGMMGNMMQGMNEKQQAPPPAPTVEYMVSVGGQQAGPYKFAQLKQFVAAGEFTKKTHVWKQGMETWEEAGNVQELSSLFQTNTAPPPPQPSI